MKNETGFGLKTTLYFWLALFFCAVSISGKGYSLNNNRASSQDNKNLKELDNLEYAVYTDFFGTEKLPISEIPQFFEYTIKSRKIFENTFPGSDVKPEVKSTLQKLFSEAVTAPFDDFIQKNTTEYLVKDKIQVPDMTVFSKEQRAKLLAGKLYEVPSHVTGEYVSVSRIGFNKKKDVALFRIIWNGSALVSYYVMMQKKENKWLIVNIGTDKMIIY